MPVDAISTRTDAADSLWGISSQQNWLSFFHQLDQAAQLLVDLSELEGCELRGVCNAASALTARLPARIDALELGPEQAHIGDIGYAVEIVRYGPTATAFPAYLLPERYPTAALAEAGGRLAVGKLDAKPETAYYNVLDERGEPT